MFIYIYIYTVYIHTYGMVVDLLNYTMVIFHSSLHVYQRVDNQEAIRDACAMYHTIFQSISALFWWTDRPVPHIRRIFRPLIGKRKSWTSLVRHRFYSGWDGNGRGMESPSSWVAKESCQVETPFFRNSRHPVTAGFRWPLSFTISSAAWWEISMIEWASHVSLHVKILTCCDLKWAAQSKSILLSR